MIRRRTALTALALPALIGRAHAQAFPDQPVRLIVPFAAGGPADLIARTVGRAMGEKLGKPVVVEARAGAGGLIGIDYVAKSRPDGHTLVLASSGGMVILPHLQPNMPYDPRTDLSPITQVLAVPQIVSISPGLGPRNLAESSRWPRRARGNWPMARPASVPRCIWPGNCSSCAPASTSPTSRSAVPRRR